jgi:hypothetical protein
MSEGLRFLLIVVGLAAMYWFIWRPDINGWKIPFVKTKAEKAEAIFNATADEIKRSLGSLSKEDISKMSLEEICKVTGAVETHVRVELRQRMWNCADYDAVATRKRLDSIRERTNQ